MAEFKVGDRVRFEAEGTVKYPGGAGYVEVEFDGSLYSNSIFCPEKLTKIEPTGEQFGPGDVIRHTATGLTFALDDKGCTEVGDTPGRGERQKITYPDPIFTSRRYERVPLS